MKISLLRPAIGTHLFENSAQDRRSRVHLIYRICVAVTLSYAAISLAQDKPTTIIGGANYRIDDIGLYDHIADDVLVTLSQNGTVAYWVRTNGKVHAATWRSGHVTTTENLPGYPNSIARSINGKGDIAGWMNTSGNLVDSLSTTRGFIRRGGNMQVVPSLGGRDGRVYGLNDRITAVGAAYLANGARHAFMLAGASIADLGTLPSGQSSSAFAISNRGVVVGAADVNGKVSHAVVWVDRKITDLGTLDHGSYSSARAINDAGQIVGFSETADGIHAFLYSKGAMQDLGTLGSEPSEASGINNRGEVVGASNITGTKRRAFLWRNDQMVDLNTLLAPGADWLLLDAFSINDRGQIVCSGRRKGESTRLLLLTPEKSGSR